MSGGADSGDIPKRVPARRGFSVAYKGLTLLSNIDPIAQAERPVEAIPMQERTLYFCASPLLGYGLERLLARIAAEAPNSAVLCIEADTNLFKLSEENFPAELKADARLKLISITEPAALCAYVRQTWGGRQFRRVTPVRLGGGWRLSPELYDSLEETLRRDIAQDWSNALIMARLGRLYMRNSLRNLALLPHQPPVTALSFGNVPTLLLGAGPSLDPLLDGLAQYFGAVLQQDSARPFRIVCVDTALGALKARNIKPDLAVVLESQYWNLRDFIGLGDWAFNSAVDISALPASARLRGLTTMLFFTPWTQLQIFGRLKQQGLLPPAFPPLGSVGLSAAAITLRISTGTVITAGLDFSFTPDAYHARSTPGHRDKLRELNRFQTLLNTAAFDAGSFSTVSKSGVPVYSNPVMRNYRNLFEQEFSHESRLFDVSGTGLALGIKTLSLEQCFDLLGKGGGAVNSGADGGGTADAEQESAGTVPQEKLADFIQSEKARLNNLRDILTGGADAARLDTLIDECDYLWAHFPDYAGGQRPDANAIAAGTPQALSFLKRIRAEIEPVLAIFDRLGV